MNNNRIESEEYIELKRKVKIIDESREKLQKLIEIEQLFKQAEAEVQRLKREGWTPEDFSKALVIVS